MQYCNNNIRSANLYMSRAELSPASFGPACPAFRSLIASLIMLFIQLWP
jgi:hypothetical protein